MSNNTYYWVCPECGANLDPGEKCDCRKKTVVKIQRKTKRANCMLKNKLITHDNIYV